MAPNEGLVIGQSLSGLKTAKDAVFIYKERSSGGDGGGVGSENETEAACKSVVYHTIRRVDGSVAHFQVLYSTAA